jgi:tRNA threonylcarbamoyladenosine modification (KEOPS) complex Cgi121 subunit
MDASLSAEVRLEPMEAEQELLKLRSAHPALVIQLLRMKKLPSAAAVSMIAAQTLRAKETDCLLASKPEVDLLLRLAGTNQITEAMKESGYRSTGKRMMLVAAGPETELAKLKKNLKQQERYSLREVGDLDEEDLICVEDAALLGTKV